MSVHDAVVTALDQAEKNNVSLPGLWWSALGAACLAMPDAVLEAEQQARKAHREWLVARHPDDAEFVWYIDEAWWLAEALAGGGNLVETVADGGFDLDRLVAARDKYGVLYGGRSR